MIMQDLPISLLANYGLNRSPPCVLFWTKLEPFHESVTQ